MFSVKRFYLITCLCLFFIGYPLQAHSALLMNEGFEDGILAPWYQDRGTLDYPYDEFWNITSTRSFSGSYSATNVGNNELRQDFAPTPTSQITEVSFYVLREIFALDFALQFHYSDNTYEQVIFPITDINVWELVDATNFLDDNKELMGISLFGIRSSDDPGIRTYIDDVKIAVVPLPASIVLMISVLVPYGLAVRRSSRIPARWA